jgi:hypothetical protein
MNYRYTERDLLAEAPYHYMFTPFEGEALLTGYVQSRLAAINGWDAGAPALLQAAGDLPEPGTGPIETETLLRQLTGYALGRGDCAAPAFRHWAGMFVRKFETFKRLRRSYTVGLTALDRTLVDGAAYAHLGFVAAQMADAEDLRVLNALLKINDHVLSAPVREDLRGLVHHAVQREVSLVAGLAGRLGLAFPEMRPC